MTEDQKMGIKDRLSEWLLSQGASTVLLFLILVGLWQSVPKLMAQIADSYERINTENKAERSDIIKRFSEDRSDDRKLIQELKMERRARTTSIEQGT